MGVLVKTFIKFAKHMMLLNVNNEFGKLKTVVLGVAKDFGGTPKEIECYDPKSRENVLNGTFPSEENLCEELKQFFEVLIKHNVQVLRPKIIKKFNQIFIRDIAFVIDNKIIVSNIINDRKQEVNGIDYILDNINSGDIVKLNTNSQIEGGDVVLHNNFIFIGYSKEADYNKYKVARTNQQAVNEITTFFPDKDIISFELNKSDMDARENALHLDCCFQPIGKKTAIIYEGGFKNIDDIIFLNDIFGNNNLIKINKQEMYDMNSNIFSISDNVIVSAKSFSRLNSIFRMKGFVVEEIDYSETAKMEGLLRCSTMPLIRS